MTAALRYFDRDRYELLSFVVMDDHVHVLFTPADAYRLEELTHSWKSYSAHQLCTEHGRSAPVWQAESYDHVVRDERALRETAQYIIANPERRWPWMTEYPWLGGRLIEGPADSVS